MRNKVKRTYWEARIADGSALVLCATSKRAAMADVRAAIGLSPFAIRALSRAEYILHS